MEDESVEPDFAGRVVEVMGEHSQSQAAQHCQQIQWAADVVLALSIRPICDHEHQQADRRDHRRPGLRQQHNQQHCRDDDYGVEKVKRHGESLLCERVAKIVKGVGVEVKGQEGDQVEQHSNREDDQTGQFGGWAVVCEEERRAESEVSQVEDADVHHPLHEYFFGWVSSAEMVTHKWQSLLVILLFESLVPAVAAAYDNEREKVADGWEELQTQEYVEVVWEKFVIDSKGR